MTTIEVAAGATGIVLGIVAAVIWEFVSARVGEQGFWTKLQEFAAALVSTDDEQNLWSKYLELLKLSASYVFRQLITVVATFAPLVLLIAILHPLATHHWNSHGDTNSLWPYLNDFEFAFLIGISFASLAGMVFFKLKKKNAHPPK